MLCFVILRMGEKEIILAVIVSLDGILRVSPVASPHSAARLLAKSHTVVACTTSKNNIQYQLCQKR